MELESFFRPLDEDIFPKKFTLDNSCIGDYTQAYTRVFPDWRRADIIVIGCDEDRQSRQLKGSALAPDQIRRQLYPLAVPKNEIRVADLGNLNKKERMYDYYDALTQVMNFLLQHGKFIILLGGSQDITYGQYLGYQGLETALEYVHIDSRMDVMDSDFGISNQSYNHKIFLHAPNYLFNFTNLGYQSYFVPLNDRKRLQNLYFQGIRIGDLRNDLREAEPFLRNANMVSVDMGVVRSADAPGSTFPSPAGFTVEEICQLMRYAGMGNRLSSVSICEVQPMKDFNGQTTLLAGMMIWYLIEGFYNRRVDEPKDLSLLTKYRISLQGGVHEIVFYKNPRSERWWMEVPYGEALANGTQEMELIPCSESDFRLAREEDEIPDRWWMAHYKLK